MNGSGAPAAGAPSGGRAQKARCQRQLASCWRSCRVSHGVESCAHFAPSREWSRPRVLPRADRWASITPKSPTETTLLTDAAGREHDGCRGLSSEKRVAVEAIRSVVPDHGTCNSRGRRLWGRPRYQRHVDTEEGPGG